MHSQLTVSEAYRICLEAALACHDSSEARAVVNRLFEDLFGYDKTSLLTKGGAEFEKDEKIGLVCERLKSGEPVQYIIGHVDFLGVKVRVNKHVLIPRPETEELMGWIFEREIIAPSRCLDVCTGSGCIALALRKRYPEAKVYATDISQSALDLAATSELDNFEQAGVRFIHHDILKSNWQDEWPDIVVCNPPYIMKDESKDMSGTVLDFEPEIALFAEGPDPLVFYKRIIEIFTGGEGTRIYFELNPLTADDLKIHCQRNNLIYETGKDMSGKERFMRVIKNL